MVIFEWKYLTDVSNDLAQKCIILPAIMKEEDMKSATVSSEVTSRL